MPPPALPVIVAKVIKIGTELMPAIIYVVNLYRSKRKH